MSRGSSGIGVFTGATDRADPGPCFAKITGADKGLIHMRKVEYPVLQRIQGPDIVASPDFRFGFPAVFRA